MTISEGETKTLGGCQVTHLFSFLLLQLSCHQLAVCLSVLLAEYFQLLNYRRLIWLVLMINDWQLMIGDLWSKFWRNFHQKIEFAFLLDDLWSMILIMKNYSTEDQVWVVGWWLMLNDGWLMIYDPNYGDLFIRRSSVGYWLMIFGWLLMISSPSFEELFIRRSNIGCLLMIND